MVTKSKLKLALADEKGVDFVKLKEKNRLKALRRAKAKKAKSKAPVEEKKVDADGWEDEEEDEDEDEEEDEDEGEGGGAHEIGGKSKLDIEALDDSDSDESEIEMEERIIRPKKARIPTPKKTAKHKAVAEIEAKAEAEAEEDEEDEEDDDDEDDEEEEDIPVSDLEDLEEEDKEDLIPHTRLTINNTVALLAALNRIRIPTDASAPFVSHQSVVSDAVTADAIPDVSDDLARELQLYKQSRDAVLKARALLRKEGVPFMRPNDYFAEMVKSEEHVGKIKDKLVEEATAKKASAEARKLRDLKKFGKQVQFAKLQERSKEKRETLDKIKALKRKRQDSGNQETHETSDLFDVGIDNELRSGGGAKSAGKSATGKSRDGPNHKRQKKDEKHGFGGKKKYIKSGDAASSGDLSGFSVKRNKGAFKGGPGGGGGGGSGSGGGGSKNRPGKARRKSMRD